MSAPPSSSQPYQELTAPSLPIKKSSPTAKTHPSLSLSHVINHINSEPPTPELHSFLSLDSAITPKTATPRHYQHHTGHYPPHASSSTTTTTSSYPRYPYPPGISDNNPHQPISTPVPRAASVYSTATGNSTWSPAIELPPLRLERLTRAFGGPGGLDGEEGEPSPSSASSYTLTPTLAGVRGRGRVWDGDSPASSASAGTATGWPATGYHEDGEAVVRGSGVFGGDTPPLREGDDGGEVEDEDERRMYWERELDLESVLSSARSSMMIVTPIGGEDQGSEMRSPALDALLKNVKVVQRESWRDSGVFGLHGLDGLGIQSAGIVNLGDVGSKVEAGKDSPMDPMDVESAAKLLEEVDLWLSDMKKRMRQLESRHLKRGNIGLASA